MLTKLNKNLEAISEFLNNISKVVLGITVALMAGIIILQVFLRYVLNSGFSWPEEVTTFLMAWMTFLGSAIAVKNAQHINIEVFDMVIPRTIHAYIKFSAKAITLLFTIFFTYYGYQFATGSLDYKANTINISLFWPRVSLVVGGILMSFHLIVFLLKDIEAGVKK